MRIRAPAGAGVRPGTGASLPPCGDPAAARRVRTPPRLVPARYCGVTLVVAVTWVEGAGATWVVVVVLCGFALVWV